MVERRSAEQDRPSGHHWDRCHQERLIGDLSERQVQLGNKACRWESQASGGDVIAVGARAACSPLSPRVVNRLAGGLVREDAEESQMSLRC